MKAFKRAVEPSEPIRDPNGHLGAVEGPTVAKNAFKRPLAARRRWYLQVPTAAVMPGTMNADMLRYMGYANGVAMAEPARDSHGTVKHIIREDGFSYYMRPSCYNAVWDDQCIGRWASFGVKAKSVLR